jgi:membrane protease YdiL (CAAX protease family)
MGPTSRYTPSTMVSTDMQTTRDPQGARARFAVAAVAWLVIATTVVLAMETSYRSTAVGNQAQLIVAEQARMFGMLALQMKSLQTNAAGSALARERMDVFTRQMEKSSRTPEDKVRLAILAGENVGTDAALTRLEELEQSNKSPEIALDIKTLRTLYNDGRDAVDSTLQDRMIGRYGFLGRLAFAYGVAAGTEPRKSLESQAFRFVLRVSLLVLVFAAIFGVSLCLFVAACVWFFKGKIQAASIPNTSPLQVFLEAFALYLLLFQISGRLIRLLGGTSVQWTWITLLILPFVAKWITLRMPALKFREAVGWHQGQGFIREFGVGIAGYFAGLPFIAVGCFITFLLIRYSGTQTASPLFQGLNGGPVAIAGLYGLACIFAPIMEETMFRGIFMHHLRQRWSWIVSAPIVSVVFAMLHPQGWVAVPALGSIAIVLAGLREWRGSLIAPMAAHACNNFLALTLALLILK